MCLLAKTCLLRQQFAPLHMLTLIRPRILGRIALAWRADHPASPATRAFLDHTGHALPPPSDSHINAL